MALEDHLDSLTVPFLSMMSAASADTLATYLNIVRHGLDLEANPLVRYLSYDMSVSSALLLPKVVTGGFALLASFQMERNETYREKGKHLLYGAAAWWSLGFLSNFSILLADYLPQ